MRIDGVRWLPDIVDKLATKHHVDPDEVEEVLQNSPRFFWARKGNREGEDVYLALGQTDAGRYLAVAFIHKINSDALILSARDMIPREKRRYGNR